MSTTYNGGPAFPRPASVAPRMADIKQQDGMTLRDYFAAKALHAFIRNAPPHLTDEPSLVWAQDAYEMADAMLKAREA